MAIYRLLRETAFEPEAVEAMSRAYEDLLLDLKLTDREHPFTQVIAKHVIEVASMGVRQSDEIRKQVLNALRHPS